MRIVAEGSFHIVINFLHQEIDICRRLGIRSHGIIVLTVRLGNSFLVGRIGIDPGYKLDPALSFLID